MFRRVFIVVALAAAVAGCNGGSASAPPFNTGMITGVSVLNTCPMKNALAIKPDTMKAAGRVHNPTNNNVPPINSTVPANNVSGELLASIGVTGYLKSVAMP